MYTVKRMPESIEQEDEDESENDADDPNDFYNRELKLLEDWKKVEFAMLPEAYWRPGNHTKFKTKKADSCFDDAPFDEYN